MDVFDGGVFINCRVTDKHFYAPMVGGYIECHCGPQIVHPYSRMMKVIGFRHWAPHLALLFLLLCLILSAITIERTMKYLHVSSELETLATNHQTMNNSLMKNLQSKGHVLTTLRRDLQNTEQRVKQLTEGTEELASSLQKTKDELQTQKTMEINARTALERAEQTLSEEQSKLNQWEKEICPKNWILVGGKCLLLMYEEGSWTQCDNSCKSRDANLIVVQLNDQKLQAFLSNKTGDSWVGKELRYKENGQSWEWPDQYGKIFGNCWYIRNGNLMSENCSKRKKCVCEQNLVLTTIKRRYPESTYQYLGLVLWNTEYNCWKKQ
ncbi:uncharacterized protein LOC142709854 [Rhinoderma darwinii]|uniref:uncharacterized protein LOC142709854 n=1 Tax=Rhinoderma darwinii TaxID=43563 RepID=UPI003F6821B0